MKKILQLLAIATLLTWGVVFLYFYVDGRIDRYLDPSFRVYALLSGIGMLVLGGFNFLNRNRAIGLCTHDHAHGDACTHDHDHDHGDHHDHEHDHDGEGEHADCCGGHDQEHGHEHHGEHVHDHDDDHDGCCGGHEHEHEESDHVHAHDHEDSNSGLLFSLVVLLIPLLVATAQSQDRFSTEYLMKWGKIERQMMQMRIAARSTPGDAAPIASVDPAENPYTRESIENAEQPTSADTPPEGQPAAKAETPGNQSAESSESGDSWATFTLEDLKQMVPQSEAGDFLLDVPQIFYTAGDKELMDVMEGIPVETTAQLMEETLSNPNGHRLKAFRLFIECCAADARPLSIPVDFGKAPPEYVEMGWYQIFGKLHYSREDGEILPILEVERIEETTEPTDGLIF